MKKIILLTGLVLVSIVYAATFCYGNNWDGFKTDKTSLFMDGGKDTFKINGENIISLAYDFILPAMVTIDTNNAKQDIKIYRTTPVSISPLAMLTLKKSDVQMLYRKASKPPGGNYITAVEIFYGFSDSTNSLSYYFLPVCLQAMTSVTPPATCTYTSTSVPSPSQHANFYVYNSSGDSIAPATNKQLKDTTNYIDSIKIAHFVNDPKPWFNKFPNSSTNLTADTKYVIFPFQELFHMFEQNGVTSLTVYNIAISVPVAGEYYTKHDLLLTPFSGGGGTFSIDEDLGHMVPPDYGNITYAITQ